MANQWLRLWHDMPNDPKWRTIARAAKQPIALVQAVYVHMLVDASRNVTRGHVDVTNEDLASALDVTEDAISAIREAMQSRVLDDDMLTGWASRQPAREDSGSPESGAKSSAERKRAERERKAAVLTNANTSRNVTQCHDTSRNVTTDKDKEEIRKEEPTVLVNGKPLTDAKTDVSRIDCPYEKLLAAWRDEATSLALPKPVEEWTAARKAALRGRWSEKLKLGKYQSEAGGLVYWRKIFAYIEASDFLTGRAKTRDGERPFRADIDWVFNPTNLQKILEAKYVNEDSAVPA